MVEKIANLCNKAFFNVSLNKYLLVRKAITPPEMIPTDITTNPKQNPTNRLPKALWNAYPIGIVTNIIGIAKTTSPIYKITNANPA